MVRGRGTSLAMPVLLHGTQRPRAQALRLAVVRVQPQVLQLGVGPPEWSDGSAGSDREPRSSLRGRRPAPGRAITDLSCRLSSSPVEPGTAAGSDQRKRPKRSMSSGLLQILADSSHLLRCEQRQEETWLGLGCVWRVCLYHHCAQV